MATIYKNEILYSGSGDAVTYDDMGGATSSTSGTHGLVPAPSAGDNTKFLKGDGDWALPTTVYQEDATSDSSDNIYNILLTGDVKGSGNKTTTSKHSDNLYFKPTSNMMVLNSDYGSISGTVGGAASLTVSRKYNSGGNGYVNISYNDITMRRDTWDGSNTSLKAAIASIDDNVEANPSSTPTETLSTLRIKNTTYNLPVGGKTYLYGFHIDGSESAPGSMVTYIEDAVGMTPAHMDYTNNRFNYGSWGNAFFLPRPCILGQDGTVIKYLDPNDYTKDIDGNTVAIDSGLTGANVMIEFPKIWYKVVPDTNDNSSGSVYISNKQYDSNFKDYAYIDYQGIHKEHFYMPAYNGSVVDGVMRSISGAQVSKSLNGQTEINYATANGNGWNTEDFGEIMLINFLLILIGKSTDTQSVFGQGLHFGGTEALNDGFRTGVHNDKGLFYGTNSGTMSATTYTNAVKVFGIENWWGFQWRRYLGHVCISGQQKVKMCYGTEDGSTASAYSSGGTGYVDVGEMPSGTSGGYINKMTFDSLGMFSSISSGSASTYYCDGQWFNNSASTYAVRGGRSHDGALVGAFCVNLNRGFGDAWWYFGAAVSYK